MKNSSRVPGSETPGVPKRKHRATGKPLGGCRAGAGRPKGSRNILPLGSVEALKAVARARAGEGCAPDLIPVIDRSVQRIADVLEEAVHFQAAPSVLKAATTLCDFAAGQQKQTVEHELGKTLEQLVLESMGKKPEGAK